MGDFGDFRRGSKTVSEDDFNQYMEAKKRCMGENEEPKPAKKKLPIIDGERPAKMPAEKEVFTSDADEPVISLKEHEDKVSKLQGRIEELTSKVEQLKTEKKEKSTELTATKKSLELSNKKYGTLEGKYDTAKANNLKLTEEIRGLKNQIKELKKTKNDADQSKTIDSLKDEIKQLKTQLSNSNEDCEKVGKELESLKKENSDLKYQLDEAAKAEAIEEPEKIIIRMISATAFESDRFVDGIYSVKMNQRKTYITFTPNKIGSALCKNGTINIPLLEKHLAFDSPKEYEAIEENGGLRINL